MKRYFSTKKIVTVAIFIALTTAATLAIKIPSPATEGYVNVGDTVVMFSAVLFGPVEGFIIGGVGSCLSDLISGYPHWILPTFIIKGIEGFVIGLLFRLLKKVKLNRYISSAIVSIIGGGLMVAGYFFASWIMKGSAAVAATSVPGNCMQWLFSVILSEVLLVAVERTGILKKTQLDNNFAEVGEIDIKDKKNSHTTEKADKGDLKGKE